MLEKDGRIKIINEVLNGIKVNVYWTGHVQSRKGS